MHEIRFLAITSVLVLLIGAPAVYSIVRNPYEVSEEKSVNRGIASVSENLDLASSEVMAGESKKQGVAKSVTLQVNCDQQNFEVDGTHLRLISQLCDKELKDLQITNQSNGFTASVFVASNEKFSTDFIDLNLGLNELKITGKDSRGHSVSRLVKVRRIPASL